MSTSAQCLRMRIACRPPGGGVPWQEGRPTRRPSRPQLPQGVGAPSPYGVGGRKARHPAGAGRGPSHDDAHRVQSGSCTRSDCAWSASWLARPPAMFMRGIVFNIRGRGKREIGGEGPVFSTGVGFPSTLSTVLAALCRDRNGRTAGNVSKGGPCDCRVSIA